MIRYFIETSVIVGYHRGQAPAISLLEGLDGELTSSYICLAELYEGIYRVKERASAEVGVKAFFSGLNTVFGINKEIAREFGKIRAHLKRKGQTIEDIDILIAATCLANELTLVTLNLKHFSGIRGLKLRTEGEKFST